MSSRLSAIIASIAWLSGICGWFAYGLIVAGFSVAGLVWVLGFFGVLGLGLIVALRFERAYRWILGFYALVFAWFALMGAAGLNPFDFFPFALFLAAWIVALSEKRNNHLAPTQSPR